MRLGEKFKNVKKLLEGKEVVENNIIEKYKIVSPSFVICRRNTFLFSLILSKLKCRSLLSALWYLLRNIYGNNIHLLIKWRLFENETLV